MAFFSEPQQAMEGDEYFMLFKEGDQTAMSHYYQQYHEGLYYFVQRFTAVVEDIEDIVTDAFAKLWLKRDKIQSPMHLKRFLFDVAKKAALSLLRWYERKERKKKELKYLFDEGYADAGKMEDEILIFLKKCLDRLPEAQGDVLRLYYLHNKSCREIAAMKGLSYHTVRGERAAGLKKLKKIMSSREVLVFYALLFYQMIVELFKKN